LDLKKRKKFNNMNKMTLTHIGIFLVGAAVGYLVAKEQKKDKVFAGFTTPGLPDCPECFRGNCIERRTITGALSSTGVVVKCSTTPSMPIPTTPPPIVPIKPMF